MGPMIKSRKFRTLDERYEGAFYSGWGGIHFQGQNVLEDSEWMETFNHPGYQDELGRRDVGGPWRFEYTRKTGSDSYRRITGTRYTQDDVYFKGRQFAVAPGSATAAPLPAYVANSLDALGTTAIARVEPTNPNAGLLTFIGEVRNDGIPAVIGNGLLRSEARKFKELGSEYLNVEFGWRPFVSDLRTFGNTVSNMDVILSKYRKGVGKPIKRRYNFPVESAVSETTPVANQLAFPNISIMGGHPFFPGGNPRGTLTTTDVKKVSRWFEGCFTYYLPVGDSQAVKMARFAAEANKLLGTRITPEAVWNLTPWTWALDWLGNFGDIAHNVSAFLDDSLVMRYGYMMESIEYSRIYTWQGPARSDGVNALYLTVTNGRKRRVPATPYGFGLTFDGFSDRQKAIIAALGISRSR